MFTDLFDQRTTDSSLRTFADMSMGKRGMEFDSENMKILNQLKEAKLPAKYIGYESFHCENAILFWFLCIFLTGYSLI